MLNTPEYTTGRERNIDTPILLPSLNPPDFWRFVLCCKDFERISLNAMEERVLPPEIRLKIVFAQANAVEEEEERLEADVSLNLHTYCNVGRTFSPTKVVKT